jgi:hypothetical protein
MDTIGKVFHALYPLELIRPKQDQGTYGHKLCHNKDPPMGHRSTSDKYQFQTRRLLKVRSEPDLPLLYRQALLTGA